MERLPRFAICSPAVRNNAAMKDEILEAIIPHSDFGDPECCGCLYGLIRGRMGFVKCNECGVTLKTVPAADL